MTTGHDYAGCGRAACRLCDAFGDGWSQGKTKMRDEIVAAAAGRRHAPDCGCVPCAAVRGCGPERDTAQQGYRGKARGGRRLVRTPHQASGRGVGGESGMTEQGFEAGVPLICQRSPLAAALS